MTVETTRSNNPFWGLASPPPMAHATGFFQVVPPAPTVRKGRGVWFRR
jgi:hypothetical protein